MPDVVVTIGGREFEVACAEGEEHFLRSAAGMLDNEAASMMSQIRHLTESRMLLMAGLMLADKTAGLEDSVRMAERRIAELEAALEAAERAGTVPEALTDSMSNLVARAEYIAQHVEAKLG